MAEKAWRSVKLSRTIIDALEARWPELSQHPTVRLLGVGDSLSSRVTAALYLALEGKPPRRRRAARTPPAGTEAAPTEAEEESAAEPAAVEEVPASPVLLPELGQARLGWAVQSYREGTPAEEIAKLMNGDSNYPRPVGGWTGPAVRQLVHGAAGA